MARSRNLKPAFFLNDKLAEIDPLGRLLFQGLWCLADRAGRLEDRIKRIKASVLPYDMCDVNALLDDLNREGFVMRYSVEGDRFIQVVNFAKHQNPHHREIQSIIPPPDTGPAQGKPGADTGPTQGKPGNSPNLAVLIPDSLNLIPDSLLDDRDRPSGVDGIVSGKQSVQQAYSPEFEQAWGEYPKRIGGNSKAAAYKSWQARIKSGKTPHELTEGMRRYNAYLNATGKIGTAYVKQAATFWGPDGHYLESWEVAGNPISSDESDYSPEMLEAMRSAI